MVDGRRHADCAAGAHAAAVVGLLPTAVRAGNQSADRFAARVVRGFVAHAAGAVAAFARQACAASGTGAGLAISHAGTDGGSARGELSAARRVAGGSSLLHVLAPTARWSAPWTRLRERAIDFVRDGSRILLLTDRTACDQVLPIPMAMATGAVHHALVKAGLRTKVGLALEAGDCRDLHHAAVLIGYGAGAVCPWLMLQTARSIAGDEGEAARAEGDAGRTGEDHVEDGHLGARQLSGGAVVRHTRPGRAGCGPLFPGHGVAGRRDRIQRHRSRSAFFLELRARND